RAHILPVKGFDANGGGTIDGLARGILYAAENGADVINNSWACVARCPSDPVAEDAVIRAHSLGAVVVFAAGNSTDDVAHFSPQNRPEVIVVGASTPNDTRAFFSNSGFLDVMAPGAADDVPPPAFEPFRNILSLKAATCNAELCPPELVVGGRYLRQ